MELYQADTSYEIVLHYNETKETQIRLTVNVFRGVEYLHVREYYLSFDEEWCPTPKGCGMPLDLNNVKQMFIGLIELLSDAEANEIVDEVFKGIYERKNTLLV